MSPRLTRVTLALFCSCLWSAVSAAEPRPTSPGLLRPQLEVNLAGSGVVAGYDGGHIQVKFLDDLDIGIGASQ